MSDLSRLTTAALRKAEASGKAQGWYDLCRRGYLPAEIATFAEPVVFANDVVQRVRQFARGKNLAVPVSCAPKQARSEQRAAPEDWRAAFRSTVMRTGMCLSLSQPMLEYLCAVADGVTWDRSAICGSTLATPCNSLATSGSLEKRGLIRRKPPSPRAEVGTAHEELTEAGEAVIALLKSVGIFIEADRAIEKKARR